MKKDSSMPVVGTVCKATRFGEATRLWDFLLVSGQPHALSEWMCASSTRMCEVDAGECFSSRDLAGIEGDAVCSLVAAKQRAVLD